VVRPARRGVAAGGGIGRLWPERLRLGPLRAGTFSSPLHDERAAAVLGMALGVAFSVCFATGVLSHLIQHPPSWFEWPARPAGLYRVTQGLHVAAGIAAVPLLLVKLWVVYPKLFTWPPAVDVAHALERAGLLVLVAGSVFMLFTGVADIALWYPWGFFFPAGHYWGSWITIGALVAHVGAKSAITRRHLPGAADASARARTEASVTADAALTRRGLLTTAFAAAGVLTLSTVGQTVAPLRRLSVLAPRRPDTGPQGLPVNKTAAGAGVTTSARDPGFRLVVTGAVARPLSLSRADLEAMAGREVTLPIACVEGWSAEARWRGVPVRDLLRTAGAAARAQVDVESLQPRGRYRRSVLSPGHAADPDTLMALFLDGEPLALDHGYPVRLIGPNRPGVLQTKWVSTLRVRAPEGGGM
jgi:DMSO/TMAO reductase YedYZ molybdopterin-dependent catalytic subunit